MEHIWRIRTFPLLRVGRDCYLYSRNKKYIQDIRVTPDLDANYTNGTLDIALNLNGSGTVELNLADPTGKNVATAQVSGNGKSLLA